MTGCCHDINCKGHHHHDTVEKEQTTIASGVISKRDFLTIMGGGVAATAVMSALPGGGFISSAVAQGTSQGAIKSIGWAAVAKDKPLERFEFTRPALGAKDVLVDIMYCGICHSDIHAARDNIDIPFPARFPVVPGHEIIGRVSQVGSAVTLHKVGDTVGVGPYIRNDGSMPGMEQYANATFTYTGSDGAGGFQQGGYANNIIADEQHTFKIPKGADLARTAPLLCAGITTYTPLKQWKIGEGSKIGIIGLGGLGHMGLKHAVNLGADVTVFTTSPEKKADALRMGAKDVVVWPLPVGAAFKKVGSFDFMLSTVPYSYHMDDFMILLKIGGVFSNVGLLEKSQPNYLFVNIRQINLTGSLTGNLADIQKVINMGNSNKNLLPEVEVIPVSQINNAIDKVMNKQARYRYVIDMATLT